MPVLTKCWICRQALFTSQEKARVYDAGRVRTVHKYCAERFASGDAMTQVVRDTFGAEVVQQGRIVKYLREGRKDEWFMSPSNKDYDPIRDGLAESWHTKEHPPEVGDVLIGEVARIDVGQNGFGRYPIVTVVVEESNVKNPKNKTKKGDQVAFHGFTQVALSQLNKTRPRVGERIRIECTNVPKEKGVRGDYWAWVIRVDRTLGEADWDNMFGVPEDAIVQGEQRQETPADEPVKVVSEEPPF